MEGLKKNKSAETLNIFVGKSFSTITLLVMSSFFKERKKCGAFNLLEI